jgi:hypothetical protein
MIDATRLRPLQSSLRADGYQMEAREDGGRGQPADRRRK